MTVFVWVKKWLFQLLIAFILLWSVFRSSNFVWAWGVLCWWIPYGYFLYRGFMLKLDIKLDCKQLMSYFIKQEVAKWVLSVLLLGVGGVVFGWHRGSWLIGYVVAIVVSLVFPVKKYD